MDEAERIVNGKVRAQGLIGIFIGSVVVSWLGISYAFSIREGSGFFPVNSKEHYLLSYERAEDELIEELRQGRLESYGLHFGPSTTKYAVDPRVFDEGMREEGIETSSFNLGLAGAGGLEVDYYVRHAIGRIESEGLPLPEWAVIDLSLPTTFNVLAETPSLASFIRLQRSERWHDLYHLKAALQVIQRDPEASLRMKLYSAFLHLRTTVKGAVRRRMGDMPGIIGLAHELKDRGDDGTAEGSEFIVASESYRGYDAIPEHPPTGSRRAFLESLPEGYAALVEEKREEFEAEPYDLSVYTTEVVRDQVEFLHSRGIRTIYVSPPYLADTRHTHALNEARPLPEFLAYDDPEEFPEYYAVANRYDEGHLNNAAAARYTRRLASDVARILGAESAGR